MSPAVGFRACDTIGRVFFGRGAAPCCRRIVARCGLIPCDGDQSEQAESVLFSLPAVWMSRSC